MPSPLWPTFSPDGRMLAVGGNDNIIRIFETATFTEKHRLAGPHGWTHGATSSRRMIHGSPRVPSASSGGGTSRRRDPLLWATFTCPGGSPEFKVAGDESTMLVECTPVQEPTCSVSIRPAGRATSSLPIALLSRWRSRTTSPRSAQLTQNSSAVSPTLRPDDRPSSIAANLCVVSIAPVALL